MTQIASTKLILAASGLVIWGYGIRSGQPALQYVGIGTMVAAVLLRFFKRTPFGEKDGAGSSNEAE